MARTLDKHHRDELDMTPLRIDSDLYVMIVNKVLKWMSGTYVDDLIPAGDKDFRKKAQETSKRFDMDEEETPPCTFSGFKIDRNDEGNIRMDKSDYVHTIKPLDVNASYAVFASVRMKLAWITHNRPDCAYEVSQMTPVTKERFESERSATIKGCNKLILHAHKNRLGIKVWKIDRKTLKVVGFSDASFANKADLTSQMGYVCLLTDDSSSAIPIVFKSYKARRVTRSVMAAEEISFSDMFDTCYTIGQDISKVMDMNLPMQLFTDSK